MVKISFNFSLINFDEEFKDCGIVNSQKLEDSLRNGINYYGLFSEVVFGPLTDYQCKCGKYSGISNLNVKCDRCGVTVESSSVRRKRFGKIFLENGYLLNPLVLDLILGHFVKDKNIKTNTLDILYGKYAVNVNTGELCPLLKYLQDMDATINPDVTTEKEITTVESLYNMDIPDMLTGPVAIKEFYINVIIENVLENIETEHMKNKFNELLDNLYTRTIPVIPPDLRPMSIATSASNFLDEINIHCMVMISMVKFLNDSPTIQNFKLALLQKRFKILIDKLLQKLSRKSGLMRRNILGKRVDYSGRAVIVPDPTLNLQQIDLSVHLVKEIFKPQILPKLAKRLKVTELETLNSLYDSEDVENDILEICKDYKGYPIILNRQPTLHRPSILVFTIRNIIPDYVIAIPPISTEVFNADFDGDAMAIYVPIGSAAFNESLKMLPQKNMFLPSNGKLAFTFCEDLVLGLNILSRTEEGKNKLKEIVPIDFHDILLSYIDKGFTQKNIHKFLNVISSKITNYELYDIVNSFAKNGHSAADISVSLIDFKTADKTNIKNPVTMMIESGSRGKWDQIDQIRKSRGFVSDVEGRVIPNAIESSLLKGLTEDEFFTSCYGSIKGLIDSAKNTAMSGYLTRRLIYLTGHILLSNKVSDCGTSGYLEVKITEEEKENFLYRYIITSSGLVELTYDNIDSYVNKIVKLRSPIKCKCPNGEICHTCYGTLYRKHTSRQIGYIASQAIGERSTQLTLKTKHTSGALNIELYPWFHIKDGYLHTDIPTCIQVYGDTILISDNEETEVIELPNASIKLITSNYEESEIDDVDEDKISDYVATKYNVFNSGKIAKIEIRSSDVVTAISDFSTFIRTLTIKAEGKSIEDLLKMFTHEFGFVGLASVNYEILLSVFCRRAINIKDQHRHFQDEPIAWIKESEVISLTPMQSLVFERFSQKLPKVLISEEDKGETNNILLQMITFDFGDSKIYEADGSIIS